MINTADSVILGMGYVIVTAFSLTLFFAGLAMVGGLAADLRRYLLHKRLCRPEVPCPCFECWLNCPKENK